MLSSIIDRSFSDEASSTEVIFDDQDDITFMQGILVAFLLVVAQMALHQLMIQLQSVPRPFCRAGDAIDRVMVLMVVGNIKIDPTLNKKDIRALVTQAMLFFAFSFYRILLCLWLFVSIFDHGMLVGLVLRAACVPVSAALAAFWLRAVAYALVMKLKATFQRRTLFGLFIWEYAVLIQVSFIGTVVKPEVLVNGKDLFLKTLVVLPAFRLGRVDFIVMSTWIKFTFDTLWTATESHAKKLCRSISTRNIEERELCIRVSYMLLEEFYETWKKIPESIFLETFLYFFYLGLTVLWARMLPNLVGGDDEE
jgi:hypothetical protein